MKKILVIFMCLIIVNCGGKPVTHNVEELLLIPKDIALKTIEDSKVNLIEDSSPPITWHLVENGLTSSKDLILFSHWSISMKSTHFILSNPPNNEFILTDKRRLYSRNFSNRELQEKVFKSFLALGVKYSEY